MTVVASPDGAAPAPVGRLKRRSEFLAAASGRRFHTPRLSLQMKSPGSQGGQAAKDGATGSRVGLTVSRKCGGSVQRSRIKRRLRAAVRSVSTQIAERGIDLVVVARAQVINAAFGDLVADLSAGLASLDRATRPDRTKPSRPSRGEMPQVALPVAKGGPAPHLSPDNPASAASPARISSPARSSDSPHGRSRGRDHDRS
jgi:ribonuclease P protein component